jgi:hypothetical protein
MKTLLLKGGKTKEKLNRKTNAKRKGKEEETKKMYDRNAKNEGISNKTAASRARPHNR